jgi:hypothetical protein
MTTTWTAGALGVYATLEMFCGVPSTKAESVGPRPLTNAAAQFPASVGESAEEGSTAKVLPVKFPPDLATSPHAVEAVVSHGAVAVTVAVSVVEELAVIPRPWI